MTEADGKLRACTVLPSAASVSARCEPVPTFPLPPGPPTCLAWPSAAPVASRCEPFSPNRLIPASRDSGSWPGTMAAGARERAASCDAFVLSRRLLAPDAPPSRTSPLCLIAKSFPEPARPSPPPRKNLRDHRKKLRYPEKIAKNHENMAKRAKNVLLAISSGGGVFLYFCSHG